MRITIGRLYFDDTFADLKNRNIERTPAEVINGDSFILLLIKTVGERCRSGLIDDSENFEACNTSGVLCRLTLRIIKIGRHRDHGLVDLLSEIVLCRTLQLL